MKHLLLVLVVILLESSSSQAHIVAPPTLEWFTKSDAVYLVRVVSIDKKDGHDQATFKIFEVLKGQPCSSLSLAPVPDINVIALTNEYVLIHNPTGFPGCVGWALKGDPEWWPLKVEEKDGHSDVEFLGSMDKVREYLRQHPAKSN